MMQGMLIRNAEVADAQAISAIILPTIREGATYSLDPALSEADALSEICCAELLALKTP
jgi:hypothetical protein